jgi:hypothetical protein
MASVVGVVVYVATVFLGVYVVIQGHAFEGIVVLGLGACGLPLILGCLRTGLRHFAGRNARPS